MCHQPEAVVHRIAKILLAAQIALGGLHRRMPQQELNLLQFTTAVVAQLCARSPQVVGRNVLETHSRAAGPNNIPNHVLRDALAPHLARPGYGAEDSSFRNSGCQHPLIESRLDPVRNGDGADVPALAD